ncbi:MAG: STAS domain-containing protein [Woeseiaceae bacterium]|nr:STAS domain-containing protein [Woeseiaceae bacterium]
MSDFELKDKGEGRFALQGAMSFTTAQNILKQSERAFARHGALEIDLAGVGKADSAGLALIIEWKSQASARGADIRFRNVPESLLAIARTSEVQDLI